MDLSSPPKIVDQTFGWIYDLNEVCGFCPSVTNSQFNFVRQYAVQFGVDRGFGLQMHEVILELVASFLQEGLKELFKVPKSYDPPLPKNQLVASFTGFLLQILHLGENVDFPNSSNLMVELSLRSLVAILGDMPFQSSVNQELQTLLAKFEDVANEAGTAMHYAFFSPNLAKELLEDKLLILFKQFDSLKADVVDFLNLLPNSILVAPDTELPIGTIVSLDSVVHDVEDALKRDINMPFDVKDLISMLHQRLKGYQSLVRDADLQQMQCSENDGLDGVVIVIKQVAFEAEYVIKSFLSGDAPRWYVTVRLTHLIEKIKRIGTQPPKLKKYCDVGTVNAVQVSSAQPLLPFNRDLEVDDIVPIFGKQESDILGELVEGTKQRQCIFICGMAGIGKTTLAKKLYNHPSIHGHFDRRMWCTVSQKVEITDLLNSILMSLGEFDKASIWEDDESFGTTIYRRLCNSRFLVVIDDIWHTYPWDHLQTFFPNDVNGSRILLTSRNLDVAPKGSLIHELPLLSNDQCLLLLKRKWFHNGEPQSPQVENMRLKIVEKCHGLPLAVVLLAGVLSRMADEKSALKWIAHNLNNYTHLDESDSIMQTLKLSYENLPPYLKPCFLYLGVFPEDAKISVEDLKRLWIAEGFLLKEDNETAENVAEQYVKELINRNLLVVLKKRRDGGAKVCIIHDLLHDLCSRLAKGGNFLAQVYNDYSIMYNQKYPRLCVVDKECNTSVLAPFGLHLRSLFFSTWYGTTTSLFNVKLLRALKCGDMTGVEYLFDLRYLATDHVPPLVHRNANLEFLIMDNYNVHTVLTPEILKMVKLRCIQSRLIEYHMDCEPIHTSSNLEYLATVHIHNKKDIELLRCSPHLRTLKCVYGWSWEETTNPLLDFNFFTRCESLTLTCDSYSIGNLMPDIIFPSSIRKLSLSGLKLPWQKLSAVGGFPNLEVLKLGRKAFEGETWDTGNDKYPQLRYLKMVGLDFSRWLVDSYQQFPRLQQLVLNNCCYLKEIPSEIGYIDTLCVIELVGSRRQSLVNSAKKIQEELLDVGNELNIIFRQA